MLSDIYDAAIILSGDADYLPPVAAVKNRGKFVCCVSFLDRKGRQLPGGARRLSNAVDSRTDLHFEDVRKAMGIEEVLAVVPIAGVSGAGFSTTARPANNAEMAFSTLM